ncbi:hypothetical protein FRC08_001399 [Ceratobasidium sp. 394]|nr:hypothetical protein FRC08_001399 [Ceratobasidium sp. 394]
MKPLKPSPAERFRDELGSRLSVDAHLCLPSANILVGVMIDGMDTLNKRSTELSLITLRNVVSVSEEILSLGRILGVLLPPSYSSQENIPISVLQDLRFLCLPWTVLDGSSCPPSLRIRSDILRVYLSVVRLLSSYIGPAGVQDLVNDFNRPNLNRPVAMTEGYTRRVPGMGPRVIRHEPQKRRINPMTFRRPSGNVAEESRKDRRQSPPPAGPAHQDFYWAKREESAFETTMARTFSAKPGSKWSAYSSETSQEEGARGWRSLRVKIRRGARSK